ncbi:MAG: hypothetical protein IJU39_01290 [Clostridia bacterium]|nr:hypothetical protein [Clostridia bacterium]
MNGFLKFVGALTVIAGIAAAVYYAVTKFLLIEDECDDCDEISCFDEDEFVIDDSEDEEEEKAEEADAEEGEESEE